MQDSPAGRLDEWLGSAPASYLLAWETQEFDRAVVDLFGYHALQLGLPAVDSLRLNRMPHTWLALDDAAALRQPLLQQRASLMADFPALPFPEASLDLVTLPHTLELCADPHGSLSEVQRVLVPEGRVVICGLNPTSLWGLRHHRARLYRRLGQGAPTVAKAYEWIGYRRLRDWLRLLSFEVESVRFGCYRPAMSKPAWLERTAWMDALGGRWWPIFGGVYFVVAVKRVRGMRLISPAWKPSSIMTNAPVSVANSARGTRASTRKSFESD